MINLVSVFSFPKEHSTFLFDYIFNQEVDKDSVNRFLIINYEKSLDIFKTKISSKGYEEIFFIFLNEKIIGYCSFFPYRFAKEWKWENNPIEMGIFLKEDYRGKGFGSVVLEKMEKDYINPYIFKNNGGKLILAPTFNNPSINLYKRLGYVQVDDKEYNDSGLIRMEKLVKLIYQTNL